MELFPERDGNQGRLCFLTFLYHESEWSSSLKGMETLTQVVMTTSNYHIVRMELFPERDGN